MPHPRLAIAVSLVLWAALGFTQSAPESLTSSLKTANGQVIGQVTVTGAPNGVIQMPTEGRLDKRDYTKCATNTVVQPGNGRSGE